MKNLTVGVHVAGPNGRKLVDGIVAAEQAGVQCAWLTIGATAPDALAVLAAAAVKTDHIGLGTSIVPIFPRHPLAIVQSAMVVDSLAPGRLRLGIGPSHQPTIEGTWGIPFDRPVELLSEYLIVLRTAFQTGKVDYDGKRVHVHAQLPGLLPIPVMASALRPTSFRLCGELADGAISWVCPLPYLRDVAVPAIREGAAQAHRQAPPLIAHVPIAISEDVDAVRQWARRQLGHYPRLPFYSQMFQDAGFPEAKKGELSDRMIDALVLHGNGEQVKQRLRLLPSFGAGELLAMPMIPLNDDQALVRTYQVLGELAAE